MIGYRLMIAAFLCTVTAVQSTGARESALEKSEYIDPNHLEFQIPAGDGAGSFFISMKAVPYVLHGSLSGSRDLIISVYRDSTKTDLVQQIKSTTTDDYFLDTALRDVDFDGNLDFYWPSEKGASNWNYTFIVWDQGRQCFVPDPYGLDSLTTPEFDVVNKQIISCYNVNWQACSASYWKYEDKKLVEIRSIVAELPDNETGEQALYVEDLVGGRMEEVYRIELPGNMSQDDLEKAYDKFFSEWTDLDYHG